MIVNKKCISAFSTKYPMVALASKSRLFDSSFSLSSEVILINYKNCTRRGIVVEEKFVHLKWIEDINGGIYLIGVHENGSLSVFVYNGENLELFTSIPIELEVVCVDYIPSKNLICICGKDGRMLFLDIGTFNEQLVLDLHLKDVTTVSWNPGAAKIVALGMASGNIKLIDIRKGSPVSTVYKSELKGMSKIGWSDKGSTKMLVLCNGIIYAYDFNDDSFVIYAEHDTPIIDFNNEVVISSNVIELYSKDKEPIKLANYIGNDVDNINLSNDGMICFTTGNDTEIMYIPKLPEREIHIRKENLIINGNNDIKEINFKDHNKDYSISELSDRFYDELSVKVSEGNKSVVCDFLLENYDYQIEIDVNKDIDVDIKENIHLIKNDIVKYNSDQLVSINLLISLIDKDNSIFNSISDFPTLLLTSILFNDYKHLKRITNSRILAAILIYHNLDTNKDLMNEVLYDREGQILNGILTNDQSMIVNNRLVLDDNIYKNINTIEKILLTNDKPIVSKYLDEYFWYKVSVGKYDEVSQLAVINKEIDTYKEIKENKVIMNNMNNSIINNRSVISPSMNSMNRPVNPSMNNMNRPVNPSMNSMNRPVNPSMNNMNRPVNPSMSTPSFNNISNTMSNPSINIASGSSLNNFTHPTISNTMSNPSLNNFTHPTISNTMSNPSVNTINSNSSMSNTISNPSVNTMNSHPSMSNQSINTMNSHPSMSNPSVNTMNSHPSMNNQSINTMSNQSINTMSNLSATLNRSMSNVYHPVNPSSTLNRPMTPSMNSVNRSFNPSSSLGRPMTPSVNPSQSFNAPRTPSMSSNQQFNNQSMNNITNNLSNMSINNPIPKSPFINNIPTNSQAMTSFNKPSSSIQNSNDSMDISIKNRIITEFNTVIYKAKTKALEKNSIVTNRRKMQAIENISTYESINQNQLTTIQLNEMESVSQIFNDMIKSNVIKPSQMFVKKYQTKWVNSLVDLICIGF